MLSQERSENATRALQVQRASALQTQPMKFNVFYKHVTALIKARQMLRHHTDVTVIVATTTKDDSWMQIYMKSHRLQSEIFTISIENCRGVALSHCKTPLRLLV